MRCLWLRRISEANCRKNETPGGTARPNHPMGPLHSTFDDITNGAFMRCTTDLRVVFPQSEQHNTHQPEKNNKTAAHQRSMAMTRWYLISAGDFGGFCFFFSRLAFRFPFIRLDFLFVGVQRAYGTATVLGQSTQMCSAENVRMKDLKNMSRFLSSVIVVHKT